MPRLVLLGGPPGIGKSTVIVFGVYHHYILVSPDNIAHLPTGPPGAATQFIDSAAPIAVIELGSALLGFFGLGQSRAADGRET